MPIAAKAKPGAKPKGPNPYLANVPDASKADYSGWTSYMAKQATAKAAARLKAQAQLAPGAQAAASPLLVDEDEPDGTRGANDNPASAQLIKGFGTTAALNGKARVLGSLDPESITPTSRPANPEDDSAIPLAGDTGIGTVRSGITTNAVIGDGPHGSAGTGTNDFDFYKLKATAGEVVTIQTATPAVGDDLDTFVVLYDETGNVAAFNDDFGGTFDSKLVYTVQVAGTYYAMVAAYSGLPADPFDPASRRRQRERGPVHGHYHRGRGRHRLLRGEAARRRRARHLGEGLAGLPDDLRHRPT